MRLSRKFLDASLILALVAGFCDAATFTGAHELFSAHVTGNFIVFAYDLVKGADAGAWIKLISLPVFIAAVMTAGWMAPRLGNDYRLLFIEGVMLCGAGVVTLGVSYFNLRVAWWGGVMPFVIVWAMGIQNAFGRLYSKAIYAQTTVMTGNVTQLTLDLSKRLFSKDRDVSGPHIRRQAGIVGVFLAGCVVGAVAASRLGLWTVLFPGALLTAVYFGRAKVE
jgi:uncharacterized membrane protein YoaK (UPF0700 family)